MYYNIIHNIRFDFTRDCKTLEIITRHTQVALGIGRKIVLQ